MEKTNVSINSSEILMPLRNPINKTEKHRNLYIIQIIHFSRR